MSWSISLLGRPPKVVKAIEAESERLSGQSKIEFDAAKPHLIGLVMENFLDSSEPGFCEPLIKLEAAGSGSARGDKQLQRTCTAKIETLYTRLV
jgi:hypothetical protein